MKPEKIVAIIDARRAGMKKSQIARAFVTNFNAVTKYTAHLRCDEPEDNLLRIRILKAWEELEPRERIGGCLVVIAKELECDHLLVTRIVRAHELEKAAREKLAATPSA